MARLEQTASQRSYFGQAGAQQHGEDGVSGSRDAEGLVPALVNSTIGPLIAYALLAVVFFFISFA